MMDMEYLKKHKLLILIIIFTLIRFFLSYHLPNFYYENLGFDDGLMIKEFESLISGNYLGTYNNIILTKGIIYPLFLTIIHYIHLNYNVVFTIIYILSCAFFTKSFKNIINNKKILLILYIILLFNPISYSSELFQRLYRNSLSIIEMLLFLSLVIRIISNKKTKISLYLFLGIISSIMLLTREDNIWIYIVFITLFIYNIYHNHKVKNIIINLVPLLVLIINLNIFSFINYKNYGVYTYNELTNSSFKDAYIKIMQIKDDKKIDKVSISKDVLNKLIDVSEKFNIEKDNLDKMYDRLGDDNGEINNGNIIWYLRNTIYVKNQFLEAKDANKFFKELKEEIDTLFKEGKLEKEFVIPSVLINTPTINEIKELPKNFLKAIIYTSSYQNVRSFSKTDLLKLNNGSFDDDVNSYIIKCTDYHNTENIIKDNNFIYEVIRIIYKYLTIILSIYALFIYIKKIKEKNKINFIISLILIIYIVILCGITYTDTTAFKAIRYFYLGNIYILQSVFIFLNIWREYGKGFNNINALFKRGKNNQKMY